MKQLPRRLDQRDARELMECTCFNLRKASRAVTSFFEKETEDINLRATQFTLLSSLAIVEESPLSRLAGPLGMDRTTLTRELDTLKRKRLVREIPGKDRRQRIVALTEQGHRVLRKAYPRWRRAQAQVIARVGRKRWRNFLSELSDITARVQGK